MRTGAHTVESQGRLFVTHTRVYTHVRIQGSRCPDSRYALSRNCVHSSRVCTRALPVSYRLSGCTWVHNIAFAPTPTTDAATGKRISHRRVFVRYEGVFLAPVPASSAINQPSRLLLLSWLDRSNFFHSSKICLLLCFFFSQTSLSRQFLYFKVKEQAIIIRGKR